jgi:SAM-dependent methyltransferase
MTGLDLCEELLNEARNAPARSGIQPDFILGDMSGFALACQVEGAFCFGNSFGYMSHADNLRFLAGVSDCLRPGGRFVMETGIIAESLLPSLPSSRWHRVKDIFALSANRYDPVQEQLSTDYTFIRGETVQTGTATYSVYTVAELGRLLSSCGLTVESLYGTTGRQSYRLGDSRLLLTARKT